MKKSSHSLTMFSPPATIDAVHELLQTVWEKSPEVSPENQMRFETALIELVSNIFGHADSGDGVACSLTIDITDKHIEAQLRDTGDPGDFQLIETTMPDDLAESGRGIALIQAVVDEFTYENQGEHNLWRILRKLTPGEAENESADESSLSEVTNIPPQTPQPKLDDLAELKLQLGRVPNLVRRVLKIENVYIRLINADGNWVRTENGVTVVENRDGMKICDFALTTDETVCITNADDDPRILDGTIRNDIPELKSYIGHSLETKGGTRIGVLCVWGTQPRLFSAEDLEILTDTVFWLQRLSLNTQELNRASEIQRGMLPQGGMAISDYEIAGFCQPHLSAGGDFYDWIETFDGVAFTLADVMGKGIGSAIIAAAVRATIRATAWNQGAKQVMTIASQVLEPDMQKVGSFVTLIHGQLDTFQNQVRYVDAGHGLVTHVTKDGKITLLTTSNYPIGTGQNREWQILNIEMAPGDTLILISDGMLDVFDSARSTRRELAHIAVTANSAQEIIDKYKEIVSKSVVTDDVTALILRRT